MILTLANHGCARESAELFDVVPKAIAVLLARRVLDVLELHEWQQGEDNRY
jgi:hypothetical protein